jgi:phosphatidate cytidylyltransferase
MTSNMTRRIAFALVAIPGAAGLIWYGGAVLAAATALVGVLGTRELLGFSRRQGLRPFAPASVILAAVLPMAFWASLTRPEWADRLAVSRPFAGALILIAILVATLWRVRPDQRPLSSAAVTLFAPLYAAGLPAFLLFLRHAGHGPRSVEGAALALFPLVLTWICDTVAMEAGRRIGGPRLAPTVSPGKTWSGSIGGLIGALAAAPLLQVLVFERLGLPVSPWAALAVGGVAGVLGQVGDLAESLFKREANLKDSGHLIPGHGGVLDRLDSLYFVIPLTAVVYRMFGVL